MKAKQKTALSITGIIIVFIILHQVGWLRTPEHWFRGSINKTSSFVFMGSERVRNIGTYFTSKKELKTEISNLNDRIGDLYVDKVRLSELEDENRRLREQLSFFETTQYSHIGARVVGRSIDPIGTTIIIDKGLKDGVKKGDSIIIGEGVLVGRVARVEDNSSVILLINDTQSRIAATVLNGSHSIGVVEGGFGIVVRMNFIPQNEEINPGDTIITSGLEAGIPRGLVIGTIEVVEKKPQEPFQAAVLAPVHNLNDLTVVSVLTGGEL